MPIKTQILIIDKLVLMGRAQSPKIYARFKHPETGAWREKSTGTTDIKIAEDFAREFYSKLVWKVENNIPISTHFMKKLIDLYLTELRTAHDRGDLSDSNYALKVRVTKKFIRPYFDEKLLHTIDSNELQEYAVWRQGYWANMPDNAVIEYERKNGAVLSRPVREKERKSKAHLRDEKAILNSMFGIAIRKRWIKEREAPKVDFRSPVVPKGRVLSKVKPDAYFTVDEYQRIKNEMLLWALKPSKFQYRRLASYYYVMLAFNCGVRPGTGIDSLRWRDLKVVNTKDTSASDQVTQIISGMKYETIEENTDYLETLRLDIYVPTSKVGSHKSIGLVDAFSSNQKYQIVWMEMAQTFIKKQTNRAYSERYPIPLNWDMDAPLFLLPNGYRLKGATVSKYFKQFLEEKEMLYSEDSGDARSLYSTRHSFITLLVEKGLPIGLICDFTGTSIEMLRKHYTHHKVETVGREFTGY